MLRALQCHRHMSCQEARRVEVPSLAFVGGDLDSLSEFIRRGLRLTGKFPPDGPTADGLLVSNELLPNPIWRELARSVGSNGAALAVSVWRVALAICWPLQGGLEGAHLLPAFVVDYSIEAVGAQLRPEDGS